ncbi:precorrin-6y C5,15-methyltransferase (decarboxylating) subunit CbiE [Rhodoligotrophos defluvii]|uniref:precorrin-6y C5,15-methyltransferase (decarboxylating) subunit CbiE n=1 Tax=Rhodoligotrophos defluvii TaxID=2561934 RepID=UPI0010C963CE|nr:precorrin-6y C5,15-methyltransferase (decarboxylating) subunit CbiE [Rhodoligotrophos defluvii]
MTAWLSVIGIGEDGRAGLSSAAQALIEGATLVVGGARHLAMVEGLGRGERLSWRSPIGDTLPMILAARGQPVAVVASGDPFFYGIGNLLTRAIPAGEMLVIPAVSSMSLAAARLSWPYEEAHIISLCGRPIESLAPLLHPGRRILALSADEHTPAAVAQYLSGRGFGPSAIHVLERLGGANERVRRAEAAGFDLSGVARLNLLGIEVAAGPGATIIPLGPGLADALFVHDGQLTKREIRAVTLSSLAPRVGALLWDIGCGSGSISIEWCLAHPANRAIAMEEDATRAGNAAGNAAALGVSSQVRIVRGRAPQALADLPEPDAVFIGGGMQDGVLDQAWARLKPGGRLVANGVTLETEAILIEAFRRLGGDLTRFSVARLDRIGSLHGFRPAMTVTQWRVVKP